jgi:hypothetical protein
MNLNLNERSWELSISLYPGILFGFRTYEELTFNTYALYLPFISIILEVDNY